MTNPVTGIRFPPELKQRLEQYAQRLSQERGGAFVSFAAAVIELLKQALDAEDKKRKRKR